MSTNKPKATAKVKQQPQNTSTAQPGNDVDVSPKGTSSGASATGAASAAPQASLPQAGKESEETKAVPPQGDAAAAAPNVAAASTPAAAQPAKEAKAPSPKKNQPVATALIVSSKVEGFRRAGRPWSKAAQTVSIDEFTTEQVEALLGESMLDVTVVAK